MNNNVNGCLTRKSANPIELPEPFWLTLVNCLVVWGIILLALAVI